jgi:hypothetical protein
MSSTTLPCDRFGRDQTRPRQRDRHISQADRTLQLLHEHGSAWTPAPELAAISLQYCRAIRCLRKRGYVIENRTEQREGAKHGFYRLAGRRSPTVCTTQNTPNPINVTDVDRLFPDDAPLRHLDLG